MINYNLLSPYTIQKMLKAVGYLEKPAGIGWRDFRDLLLSEYCIKGSSLRNALNFYGMAINKFFGNSLIKRLEGTTYCSMEEVWEQLRPTESKGSGEWLDLAGLILPEGTARSLVARYRTGGNRFLRGCGMLFPFGSRTLLFLEWTWAYEMIGTLLWGGSPFDFRRRDY